jgi:hypothetical protein
MTRTEDRLTDALTAAARAVPKEALRPLTVPRPRPRPRRRPWRPWLAPLAAATSVALVAGLATVMSSRMPAPPAAAVPAPPRYYVDTDYQGTTVVRATATGAITATVRNPDGSDGQDMGLVASAGRRGFFVECRIHHKEIIYRFHLTGSGKVTGFAPVKGGTLGNVRNDAMAVSPDGSRLAVAVTSNLEFPDEIIVIDLRTGVRTVWRGGMNRPRLKAFSINSLSWTADGQELVFSAQWCAQAAEMGSQVCDAPGMRQQRREAEVWALYPGPAGGRLNSGRLLLRQSSRYPYLAGAVISRDGSTLTALVLEGRVRTTVPSHLSVVRISVADGRQQDVLYRGTAGPTFFWSLSADNSARYWLLDGGPAVGAADQRGFNGWIRDGQLVPLLPAAGETVGEAW